MIQPTVISPAQLSELLEDETPPSLVDVRPAEEYYQKRLPGATNHSVFDAEFAAGVLREIPFKTVPICVYGSDADGYEARMAAHKLLRAGYVDVLELRDGIDGWERAGLETEDEGSASGRIGASQGSRLVLGS